MANKNPDIESLNQYNKNRNSKTIQKVKETLDKMLANSESVNISKLAKASGVSRTTIYREEELRAIVDNFRETSVLRKNRKVKFEKEQALERASAAKLRVITDKLKEEREIIKKLREENQSLKEHIEYLTQKFSNIRRLGKP